MPTKRVPPVVSKVFPTDTPQELGGAPSPVYISKPEYKGVTVDTEMINVSNLLTHVEGSSWTVNYYSQVVDQDNVVAGQGLATPGSVQQYKLIVGMEFKVTSPLNTSQDSERNTMTVTGGATIYPFLIPNVGDMFLADVGAGREGLFQVTSVQRMSIYKQTCHTIEYTMIDYTSNDQTRVNDLNSKVIESLQYVRDFLVYGQNPLLVKDDYQHLQSLRWNYRQMIKSYIRSFYSSEYSTLILPGQNNSTYDPYLVNAILKVFSYTDSDMLVKIKQLNVDDDQAYKSVSIWDVIIQRDPNLLMDCFKQYGKVYSVEFTSDPMQEGVRYSGIDELIYPADAVLNVDYNQTEPSKMVNGESLDKAPVQMSMAALANPNLKWLDDSIADVLKGFVPTDSSGQPTAIITPPPYIHNSMMDGYYVLSKAFYSGDYNANQLTQLEVILKEYLLGHDISYAALDNLITSVSKSGLWNSMNKFYLIPILLILIRGCIRGI